MLSELQSKIKKCITCEHDLKLHNKEGRCAVMIDDIESCPCGSGF